MKKFLSMLLILSMLLAAAAAFAEDTGIQVIGGPSTEESTPVSLDDMKIGKTVKIDGFGDVTILAVEWDDWISRRYNSGGSGSWNSGKEAEYLYIKLRILNTQKSARDYAQEFHDIVCDFGDGFQFGGWYRQREDDTDGYLYEDAKASYEISPLYAGQYGVIVTLPNIVMESKEPLSVTFHIGDNEFTYHHRK